MKVLSISLCFTLSLSAVFAKDPHVEIPWNFDWPKRFIGLADTFGFFSHQTDLITHSDFDLNLTLTSNPTVDGVLGKGAAVTVIDSRIFRDETYLIWQEEGFNHRYRADKDGSSWSNGKIKQLESGGYTIDFASNPYRSYFKELQYNSKGVLTKMVGPERSLDVKHTSDGGVSISYQSNPLLTFPGRKIDPGKWKEITWMKKKYRIKFIEADNLICLSKLVADSQWTMELQRSEQRNRVKMDVTLSTNQKEPVTIGAEWNATSGLILADHKGEYQIKRARYNGDRNADISWISKDKKIEIRHLYEHKSLKRIHSWKSDETQYRNTIQMKKHSAGGLVRISTLMETEGGGYSRVFSHDKKGRISKIFVTGKRISDAGSKTYYVVYHDADEYPKALHENEVIKFCGPNEKVIISVAGPKSDIKRPVI